MDTTSDRRASKGSIWRGMRSMGILLLFLSTLLGVLLLWPTAEPDPAQGRLTIMAVTIALVGATFIVADRAPRRMEADAGGMTLIGRGAATTLGWSELAAARQGPGRQDGYLERVDGTLLRLPAGTPSGLVETWRSELGGASASDPAGQTRRWHQTPSDNGSRGIPYSMVGIFAGPAGLIPDGILWVSLWALGFLSAMSLAMLASRGDAVSATPTGLTVRKGLSQKTVRWADITDVGPSKDRLDKGHALRLDDGTKIALPPGFPAETFRQWRRELTGHAA